MRNNIFLKPILIALALLMLTTNPLCTTTVSADPGDDFVITVKTNNPGTSPEDEFTIPTYPDLTYNYIVDCDDIGPMTGVPANEDYTCKYDNPGTYTIRIKDNSNSGTGFPHIYFNNSGDAAKLLTVEQWGSGLWTSMEGAFYGCVNLSGSPNDNPNLSNVTSMHEMFRGAAAFNGDISGWDTQNVTSFRDMFYNAENFNQNIGGWNTSNVTDMSFMFYNAHAFNQDISGWNIDKVTKIYYMFFGASTFNQDIGGWNTDKVTDMRWMFSHAVLFNQDIGGWQTGAVTDMSWMFRDAHAFNQDIGGWDTGRVTDMDGMFYKAFSFDQDLGSWNVGALKDASSMFNHMTLSTYNYNALLVGWNGQELQPDVLFSGGKSTYCLGESARQNMIDSDNWSIFDAGKDCSGIIFLPLIIK